MSIAFRKSTTNAKFLDPTDGYREKSVPLEYRYDPLTGDMGLVHDIRTKIPFKTDLASIVEKSVEIGCPFCKDKILTTTPKFVPELCPEGRITVGEAIVFPNLFPYMEYSAVTAICSEHFVGFPDFTSPMLQDALTASQLYLKSVHKSDPEASYCGIMCNYMPPANSSLVHPHFQVFASRFPMAHHKELLEASKAYFAENGSVFWSDLIATEEKLGERHIGTIGNTVWMASFVPRSFHMDVRAIFRNRESILSLSSQELGDFAEGMVRIFRYLHDQNHYSYNMFIYSGSSGEESFWTHARIIQRGPLMHPMDISDASNATMLGDTRMSMRSPEFACEGLRAIFD